jgi:hypothetical protein
MKARWLASLAVLGLIACSVVMVGETEVRWSLDGTCAQYSIAEWEVVLQGRDYVSRQIPCSSSTGISTGIISVAEGAYTATVRAKSVNGAVLATRQSSGQILSTAGVVYYIDVGAFTAADFQGGACGNGVCDPATETCSTSPADCGQCTTPKVHVFWTINGTEDGSDKGLSWDTCDEVGAAFLRLTIDGTTIQDLPCSPTKSSMNASLDVTAGSHTFAAVLVDTTKTPVTSQTDTVTLSGISAAQPGELLVNFDWDSFIPAIKGTKLGDFLFTTSFEGKTCAQVPHIAHEISLLKLNGTAVTPAPQVCDASSFCYPADGNTPGKCSGPADTMRIKQVLWGIYTLLLQGTLSTKEMCYTVKNDQGQNQVDILIGAGTVNPVVPLDLKKDSTNPACL